MKKKKRASVLTICVSFLIFLTGLFIFPSIEEAAVTDNTVVINTYASGNQRIRGYEFNPSTGDINTTPSFNVSYPSNVVPTFGDIAYDSQKRFWGISLSRIIGDPAQSGLYRLNPEIGIINERIILRDEDYPPNGTPGFNSLSGYRNDLILGGRNGTNYRFNFNSPRSPIPLAKVSPTNGGDYINIDNSSILVLNANRTLTVLNVDTGAAGNVITTNLEGTAPQGGTKIGQYILVGTSNGSIYRSQNKIDENILTSVSDIKFVKILDVGENIYGMASPNESQAIFSPILNINKKADKSSARVGDTVSYTIEATNTGDAKATDVVLEDVLPQNLEKPNNIKLRDNSEAEITLREGIGNANSNGQYYTWDNVTRTLKVFSKDLSVNSKITVTYTAKIMSGNDNEKVKNTVTLSASNVDKKLTSDFTVTIIGDPKISVKKSANKDKVKRRDTVSYTLEAINSGNKIASDVLFTDVLPKELDKPENIKLRDNSGNEYTLEENIGNSNGQYYTWDSTTNTLSIIAKNLNINNKVIIAYTSKVISGISGDKIINTVTLSASNTPDKPTGSKTVYIEMDMDSLVYVKQEVLNTNEDVVVPTIGNLFLDNINNSGSVADGGRYSMTIPSYKADSKQPYKGVKLGIFEGYEKYQLKNILPEFYDYVGYQLTTKEEDHSSNTLINKKIPTLDFLEHSEYWLTIYIEPKVDINGPPFYSWDYKTNNFGNFLNPKSP